MNDKKDVGKAVSLLREAANLLAGDRQSEGNEDTASSATLGISCEAAVTNSNPAPSSNQDACCRILGHFLLAIDRLALLRHLSPKGHNYRRQIVHK